MKAKRIKSKSFHVRLPTKIEQKLGWLAAEKQVERATLARLILADAVKSAKPPKGAHSYEVLASPEQRAAWEQLAAGLGQTVEQVMAGVMDKLSARRSSPAHVS